jgi:hypothetical protein
MASRHEGKSASMHYPRQLCLLFLLFPSKKSDKFALIRKISPTDPMTWNDMLEVPSHNCLYVFAHPSTHIVRCEKAGQFKFNYEIKTYSRSEICVQIFMPCVIESGCSPRPNAGAAIWECCSNAGRLKRRSATMSVFDGA